ncbi:MAG: cytidylate kinase-like family protein [Gemmatimonadaceae bacterium]
MPVITISRLFGSGGSEVAAGVATALGWTLLDNGMVDRVAASLHATPAHVQAIEERTPTLAERIADTLAFGSSEVVSAPLHASLPPTESRLLEVTKAVIDEAVARGPLVVVGRGAQSCLADRADALHAFCYAPHDALVARIAAREHLSAPAARERVHEVNRQREQFVRRNWHRELRDATHYDVCLNTASLGIPGAIEAIVHAARHRGW